MGITPQNLKHWLTRNTFDISILASKCEDINSDWLITGVGEMIKKPEPIEDPVQNISDNVVIPREAWDIIKGQADSLKIKDRQIDEMIARFKLKDQQINDVITILKEQMKGGHDAVAQGHVAPGAAAG